MSKHIIFIFIYIIFNNIFSSEIICFILILHCIIGIVENVKTNSLSLLTMLYLGVILSTYSNITLLGKAGNFSSSIYYYIATPYIAEGTQIWCIGCAFTFIGYEMYAKKSFPSIAINITTKHLRYLYLSVMTLSVMTFMGKMPNLSFLGTGEKIVHFLNVFAIFMFARLWKKENNKKYRNYAIILCVFQIYLVLLFSYLRAEIIIPFLSLMGGYFWGLGKVKYLLSYRILPFIFVILLYSQLFRLLGANRSHFIDVFYDNGYTKENFIEADPDEDKDKGGLLDRLSNLAQITNCVKLVKLNGFYYGRASEPLITSLVPRVLWPGKPKIQLGSWFATEIGVAYVNADGIANNSINMTIPGELYLDFGWIGVLLGNILVGGLLAALWNSTHFNDSPYNLTGTVWGGYLLLYVLENIGPDLQVVITYLSLYIMFYILKRVIKI